jgi:hypothetical protein
MNDRPSTILFLQHGWADTCDRIFQLGQRLATSETIVIAPDLGWFDTWIRIEPLIAKVEAKASKAIAAYPNANIKIIGHSMGGLIWLEVLARHPEWLSKIHSLVLVASPIGGAHLARIIDPLAIGIGIAGDLGKNRRAIAEKIARQIPTLVIAGDIDNGSDGTVTVESTKFACSRFVCLLNRFHAALKNHPDLDKIIQDFWEDSVSLQLPEKNFSDRLIARLHSIPGMTDAHQRDFERSQPYILFQNGITIRTWSNPLRVDHVFVASSDRSCLYAGFVGWLHRQELRQALQKIEIDFF